MTDEKEFLEKLEDEYAHRFEIGYCDTCASTEELPVTKVPDPLCDVDGQTVYTCYKCIAETDRMFRR